MTDLLPGMKWNLKCILIGISMIVKDAKYFSMCLLTICTSSLKTVQFINYLFVRLFGQYSSTLYILNINPLSAAWLVSSFSHSLCRLCLPCDECCHIT